MLLKTFNPTKIKFPCIISPKLDGVRGFYRDGEFVSRNDKEIIGLTHIKEQLKGIPHDLDGELMVPGQIFDNASGLLRNHQEVPEAEYHIFDIPNLEGYGIIERFGKLGNLKAQLEDKPNIKFVKHTMCRGMKTLMAFYHKCIAEGYEGIVIKSKEHLYRNARSWDWQRLVPIHSEDCECTGIFPGKGKHLGRAGGIFIEFGGHTVKVGTGFSDAEREDMMINDPTGQIAETQYKEKTKAGSMRHPAFKGWRDDKV